MESKIVIYPNNSNANLQVNNRCVGIDLGTTTTIICTVESRDVNLNKSFTIPVKQINIPQKSPREYDGNIMSPKVASIIALSEGKPYVGSNLYHLKGTEGFEYKKNIFYHWKIELGIDHHPMYPEAVSEKLNMPYKIAGVILNYIKKAGLEVDKLENTIITVPASFQANQRQDVLKAANMASISVSDQMLIDEPNAAFLGYFNRLSDNIKAEWSHNVRNNNILIVDFGGGTLDLSILNVDFKRDRGITISNVAISRYNDLGGQDIDMIIAEEFLLPMVYRVNESIKTISLQELNTIILPQLATIGERLKIGICQKVNLKIVDKLVSEVSLEDILFLERNVVIEFKEQYIELGDISITAKDFEKLFKKIFVGNTYAFKYQDKTITTISSSINFILENAELGLNEINYVLFAGGSSFNPYLIDLIKLKLHRSDILVTHEPDMLISEGAAVYSYFYYTHGISLITPITSENIGVILAGNQFYPLIQKGKTLPECVSLPNFQLQTNLNNQIVIPVCINSVDFPIGELRIDLLGFYSADSVVRIDAKLNNDKIFELKVFINNDFIGEAIMDNPYSLKRMTEELKVLYKTKGDLNTAIHNKNFSEEKRLQRSIIWKYNDIDNNIGCLESAEKYCERFDDNDAWVWNMRYIANKQLGRKEAALYSLNKAIELKPQDEDLMYNYSILLEEIKGVEDALSFLENTSKANTGSQINFNRMLILKNKKGMDISKLAQETVCLYKKNPGLFSEFDKENILPKIFKIAKEPYAYVTPKELKSKEDQQKYLRVSNKPLDLTDNLF
ncbi:Hsp70 family protein [Myroides odoratimimus]|uniref:Hsp70 family protein n=1 Tax=Myroides odoratimimus TaxID=76832 RepID=UPI003D2F6AC8